MRARCFRRRGALRDRLSLPHEAASFEGWLEVHHLDLPDKSESELVIELARIARLVARDPGRFVWIGPHEFVTVRQWAEERLARIRQLLEAHTKPEPEAIEGLERWSAWT